MFLVVVTLVPSTLRRQRRHICWVRAGGSRVSVLQRVKAALCVLTHLLGARGRWSMLVLKLGLALSEYLLPSCPRCPQSLYRWFFTERVVVTLLEILSTIPLATQGQHCPRPTAATTASYPKRRPASVDRNGE